MMDVGYLIYIFVYKIIIGIGFRVSNEFGEGVLFLSFV